MPKGKPIHQTQNPAGDKLATALANKILADLESEESDPELPELRAHVRKLTDALMEEQGQTVDEKP